MNQLMPPVSHQPGDYRQEEELQRTLRLAWEVARDGWAYIGFAVLVFLTLAVLRLAQWSPSYTASSSLLVLQQGGTPMDLLNNSTNSALEMLASLDGHANYLPTHTRIIRSPLVVADAIASIGRPGLSAPAVIAGLSVKIPEDAGKVLELKYTSATRGEAEKVLEAVIASYRKFLRDNYQKNTNDTVEKIETIASNMSRELKDLEREYLQFRQGSPVAADDAQGRPLEAQRLDHWAQLGNEATVREFALRSELELSQQPARLVDVAAIRGLTAGRHGPTASQGGDSEGSEEEKLGRLYRHLGEELDGVKLQMVAAEHLLSALRADQDPAHSAVDESFAKALASEPAATSLHTEIARLKSRLDEARRRARSPSDPSVASLGRALRDREEQLEQLGARLRLALQKQSQPAKQDERIRQAEADLAGLEARASALRERREQLQRDRMDGLRHEHEQLVETLGPEHERTRRLGRQLVEAEQSPSDGPDLPGAGPVNTLSLERKLAALGRMRERIQERFDEDLKSARLAEIDRIRGANLRSNLDRQRALFNSVVDQLKHARLVGDYNTILVQVIDPPAVTLSSISWKTNLLGALALGLFSGGSAAGISRLLTNRFHSVAELRRELRYPMLVDIPQFSEARDGDAIPVGRLSQLAPRSPAAEAYKLMRTQLSHLGRDRRIQVILVTSPVSGEGKSTTASNLASCLAHAGNKVLLVDGDLRRPSLHTTLGLPRDRGLTDLLASRSSLADVVMRTDQANLDLLAAGPETPNPAELLASSRLGEALEEARPIYDYVVLDSPPLLAVADPTIIAAVTDGAVLVVRATSLCRDQARRTVEMLHSVQVNVLGTVFNCVSRDESLAYYGYPEANPVTVPRWHLSLSRRSAGRRVG